VVQNPIASTSGSVTLTITATDTGAGLHVTAYSFNNGSTRQTANNKSFAANTSGTIKVRDAVGNISSTGYNISNIDTTAPYATNVTYSPTTATSGNVTVTITANKTIQKPTGRNGSTT
jgi:hypothetical protein